MRHLPAPYLRVRSTLPLQQYLVNLVTPATRQGHGVDREVTRRIRLDQLDQSRAAVLGACSGLSTPAGPAADVTAALERDGLIQTAAALRA